MTEIVTPQSANRRLCLALRCALAVLLASAAAACERAPRPPVNLLLISIDTLRPDMLGCYGYDRPTSPTLDALATQGVLFETALTPSPWTLPAHASLLTGLYPMRHAIKNERVRLRSDIRTLAQHLRQHGFATGAIVNSHNLSGRYGLDRGFESVDYVRESVKRIRPSAIPARAVQWLAQAPQPFFLFLHTYDVHSDYRSLPEYQARFVDDDGGRVDGSTRQLTRHRRGRIQLSAGDRERLVDLYVAGIRQMDDSLAPLLDWLEQAGLLQSTLLVVTSDHGEEFLEHGGVLHGRTQYDEVLRVPLILRGSGLPSGLRVEEPVSLVDIAPTVLSLLGLPVPSGLDGMDVSPLLRGEVGVHLRDRAIFGEADHHSREPDVTRSVRYAGFKLTHQRLSGETRLYDLASDPAERVDVKEAHPERVSALREKLRAFEELGAGARGVEIPPLDPDEAAHLRALGYLR